MIEASLDPITIKHNGGYIQTGATIAVKNMSTHALQMGLHSVALELGDGSILRSVPNKIDGLPNCLGAFSPRCEQMIRRMEAVPPNTDLSFSAEFQKAVGLKPNVLKKGSATLTGAIWVLDADDPSAEPKQAHFRVSGLDQDFAF